MLSYPALEKPEDIRLLGHGLFSLCALVWYFLFLALNAFSVGPLSSKTFVFHLLVPCFLLPHTQGGWGHLRSDGK